MSKARDLADSAQEINILDGKSFLDEDNLASDSATGIASQQSIKAYVDGITTTNITSTGALNSGSITSGFGNINNGSSTITTTGAISGGSFVIGSADINENDLESIDGITAGTVSASKAVVVNTNKDITGFRNLTATGTISGTLSGAIASTTTATTQAESDDSTKVATTAYVVDKITTLIGGAPSTLNDLNELAAAINDDANYNSTLTTALATKLPLAGGTMTGNLSLGDNNKAIFGAGSDLQIYHSGSASVIQDSGDGSLFLQGGSQIVLGNVGNSESYAIFNQDGAVQLRHNNAQKFATTSTGIQVTGNIANASGDLTLDASGILNLDSAFSSGTTGGIIRLADAGTQFGDLYEDSGNFLIASAQVDKDIIFKGNDGGSIITALTLDMSDAGEATFNSGINVGNNATFLGSQNIIRADDAFLRVEETDGTDIAYFGDVTGGGVGASFLYNHGGTPTVQMRADQYSTISKGILIDGSTAGVEALKIQTPRNDAISTGLAYINVTDSVAPFSALTIDHNGTGKSIEFRDGGAYVGSIGRSAGLYIAGAACGLRLHSGGTKIFPTTSSGGATDGTVDLGAVGASWKDVRATTYYGDGSNLTGISSGAITYLTEVEVGSQPSYSITASNLDLSGYKQLIIMGNFLSCIQAQGFRLQSNANANMMVQFSHAGNNLQGSFFTITCDLTSGIATSSVSKALRYISGNWEVKDSTSSGSGGTPVPNITTSTTSVSLHTRSGYSFAYASGNGGPSGQKRSMILYGVA